MSDFPDFSESDDNIVTDVDSPFFGLPLDTPQGVNNPDEAVLQNVLDALGISNFGDVIISVNDVDTNNLRGNRFTNLSEALIYLAEAGILSFGQATINDDLEVGASVDADSGAVNHVA